MTPQELLRKLSRRRIAMDVDALNAFVLIAHVQLACRHPENNGQGRELAVRMMRKLQAAIAPVGSELWNVMEQGWQPEAKDIAKDLGQVRLLIVGGEPLDACPIPPRTVGGRSDSP